MSSTRVAPNRARKPIEMSASAPTGVPISKPRTVSMNRVNGWFSAYQPTLAGIAPAAGATPAIRLTE